MSAVVVFRFHASSTPSFHVSQRPQAAAVSIPFAALAGWMQMGRTQERIEAEMAGSEPRRRTRTAHSVSFPPHQGGDGGRL